MSSIITILSPLEIFIIPVFLIIGLVMLYRVLAKDDKPAGLVLYMAAVMLLDSYLQTGLFIPGFEKGSIKYSEIIWLLLIWKERRRPKMVDRALAKKMSYAVLFYVFLFLVAALRSARVMEGIFIFRGVILPQLMAFYIAARGFDSRDDFKRFFAYLTIVMIFITTFHVWLVLGDTLILDSATFWTDPFQRNLAERRYGSIFGNPNQLGVLIALLLPVYLLFLLSGKKFKKLFFFNVINLVFMLSQTRSRGPMLSTVPALGLMLLLKPTHLKKMAGYFLLGVIVFAVTMPGIVSQLTRRLRSEGISQEFRQPDDDYISRWYLWKTTLAMIRDHPLGIGLNGDTFVNLMVSPRYSKRIIGEDERRHLDNPHNSILEITIKAGLQTILVFAIILFMFFREAIRTYARNRDDILLGIGLGLFAYLAAINSEPVMFRPNVANLFWIIFGMGIAFIDRHRFEMKLLESSPAKKAPGSE